MESRRVKEGNGVRRTTSSCGAESDGQDTLLATGVSADDRTSSGNPKTQFWKGSHRSGHPQRFPVARRAVATCAMDSRP